MRLSRSTTLPLAAFLLPMLTHCAPSLTDRAPSCTKGVGQPNDDGLAYATVHVASPRPVQVQRLSADGEWETVCTSPCDRPLRTRETYQIAGDGMTTSHAFTISANADRVALTVALVSSDMRTLGVTSVTAGALGLAGAFLTFLAYSFSSFTLCVDSPCASRPSDTGLAVAAGSLAVLGVGGILAGFHVLATSTTSVMTPRAGASDRHEKGERQDEPPAAVWTPGATRERAALDKAMPPAVAMPVLSLRF